MNELDYSVADGIAWIAADELGEDRAAVYVARVPEGPPLLLEDAAWAIWMAVTEGGRLDDVVARAAELAGAEPSDIADEVDGFLRSLLEAGLIRDGAPDQGATP